MCDDFFSYPICLFDSGIGGLNLLTELKKRLPFENYLYVADQKYCPYGNRFDDYIVNRIKKIIEFLYRFNPKIILVACNTASRFLPNFSEYTDKVKGVILPTAKYVLGVIRPKKVLLLATKSTISGGVYQNIFNSKKVLFEAVDCGNLVSDIEGMNVYEDAFSKKLLSDLRYVLYDDFDAIIFGCTHFDFISKHVSDLFPQTFKAVFCKNAVVPFVVNLLNGSNLLNNSSIDAKTLLLTTGSLSFFKEQLSFYKIDYDEAKSVVID